MQVHIVDSQVVEEVHIFLQVYHHSALRKIIAQRVIVNFEKVCKVIKLVNFEKRDI